MLGLTTLLAEHRFAELFREELGWDQASGSISVDVAERRLTFDAVAQKHGFQVLQCNVDRRSLCNRGLLRRAQARVARGIHEHILIYLCDRPPKQVWQWAARTGDGRRLRHREHPFFSSSPPDALIKRLLGLQFSIEDEERGPSLIDALDRTRAALDAPAERNLFAKRPEYAAQSDALAVAMKNGEEGAFDKFVEFHLPLARHLAEWPRRSYHLDAEDGEQIAVLGLIRAARRFDPDRGYQFSTLAYRCILQECHQGGLKASLLIQVPPNALKPTLALWVRLQRSRTARAPKRPQHEIRRLCTLKPASKHADPRIGRALSVRSLSDRGEPEYDEASSVPADSGGGPVESLLSQDRLAQIHLAITRLDERRRRVLRMRYGIGCEPMTLEEIGRAEGITRERVRQIQVGAERRLRTFIEGNLKDLVPEKSVTPGDPLAPRRGPGEGKS